MPAIGHHKACVACTASKRKCDRKSPKCQRCLDRDEECYYPQRKRGRGRSPQNHSSVINVDDPTQDMREALLETEFVQRDWPVFEASNLDPFPLDTTAAFTPSATLPLIEEAPYGVVSYTSDDWFLREDTWMLRHYIDKPNCVCYSELKPFIDAVQEMLYDFVRDGHNKFIHQRLYENGMPNCIQDAFTTIAAYMNRSPTTNDAIMQIVTDRSSALVDGEYKLKSGILGISERLGRVQALFVYEFIALFDGSVRSRAFAEKQLPKLRQWIADLWQAAKSYRRENTDSKDLSQPPTTNDFNKRHESALELWHLWILLESVRRSHVLMNTVLNVYETMNRGWAYCPGGVMITTRKGLWETESAMKWYELSSTKDPLMVPSLQPELVVSNYASGDIDDFAKFYWTYIIGLEKMQSWIDMSNETLMT